jgi:hypothetical protein
VPGLEFKRMKVDFGCQLLSLNGRDLLEGRLATDELLEEQGFEPS